MSDLSVRLRDDVVRPIRILVIASLGGSSMPNRGIDVPTDELLLADGLRNRHTTFDVIITCQGCGFFTLHQQVLSDPRVSTDWVEYSFAFTGLMTQQEFLVFEIGRLGFLQLDDVSIQPHVEAEPVPEPATLLLRGGGLAAAAVRRRRARRN